MTALGTTPTAVTLVFHDGVISGMHFHGHQGLANPDCFQDFPSAEGQVDVQLWLCQNQGPLCASLLSTSFPLHVLLYLLASS